LRKNRCPETLNVGADDPRIPQWASAFQERAFSLGKWWGSYQLARLCIQNSCVILPREIANIEAANLDNRRLSLSNMWGQFLRPHCDTSCSTRNNSVPNAGIMTLCGCGCGCAPKTIEDRGNVVSMSTTVGTTKKIRTYCNAADNGKKITFQGYDSNGNWVRLPNADAEVIDGEEVVLSYPFVDTVTVWNPGAPTGVIKDTTLYNVLVYSYDMVSAEEVNLANYQPDETEPTYRMVSIPGFNGSDCGCSTSAGTRTLLAIVSLQSLPLVADNDWLLFQNLAAYKMGMLAEKYFEAGDIAQGDAYFYGVDRAPRNRRNVLSRTYGQGALPLLEAELRKMTSDVTATNIEFSSVSLAGFL